MSISSDVPPAQVIDLHPGAHRLITVTILSGAAAGSCVDLALYPLDTLTTRLQSQYGFIKSGGFRGIYKGIGATSVGTPITTGIFFGVYDFLKNNLTDRASEKWYPCVHMLSATVAEVACCTTKVPMEIVKQRRQASFKNLSTVQILVAAVREEGFLGLYRGFGSTIIRDVPFSLVEFPIWEWSKKKWSSRIQRELNAIEVAVCGGFAGGIAAAVTTPLDVVKTQIMLTDTAAGSPAPGIFLMMRIIYRKHGMKKFVSVFIKTAFLIFQNILPFKSSRELLQYRMFYIKFLSLFNIWNDLRAMACGQTSIGGLLGGLFAGFFPRISMIMMGGALFFGVYDKCCKVIEDNVL